MNEYLEYQKDMKTQEKQQRKFMKLNQKEFQQALKPWLAEYERRLEILTNYYEIPTHTSDHLWKELKKYPRQETNCFFCQKEEKGHLFFLDHGDFWACLDCYDKYRKLKERRSFASILQYDLNLEAPVIQQLLGHSHFATTERYLKKDPRFLLTNLQRRGFMI